MSNKALHFRGCTHLRQRVIMATLTGRSVKITEIRERDESPGLKAFEASFLRLVDKLTNGKERSRCREAASQCCVVAGRAPGALAMASPDCPKDLLRVMASQRQGRAQGRGASV